MSNEELNDFMIKIKRGLDLPISGLPEQVIHDGPSVRSVALVGPDYVGLKPTMEVSAGDKVAKGQVIFTDKKQPGVKYTAPAAGTVNAINRGAKRAFQSLVIDVEGDAEEAFPSYSTTELAGLELQAIKDNLINSGLWTALRARPFSKVASPTEKPNSIFITAIDTNPLAADPAIVIADQGKDFLLGADLLSRLTDGKVFVCKAPSLSLDPAPNDKVVYQDFSGPHPAGLVGTHIHYLDPVSIKKTVFYIGYQDVIAVGKLFAEGKLYTDRIVSLCGPQIEKPCLVKTRVGADLEELVAGRMKAGENRIISGSVLSGRTARGAAAYLGRYHTQVSVLEEGRERVFMRYMSPGSNSHSALGIYLTSLFNRNRRLSFTTTTNGSERAMVPVGTYEQVMPLDILPTQLLRALIVGDTDNAQLLGCLELDEEDLSLCTYVCPGKYEYGTILRDNLNIIEKEG